MGTFTIKTEYIRDVQGIGQWVRLTRKAQHLSQVNLAGISGTARRFIVDLEKGKETLQTGKMLKVLAALGLGVRIDNRWSLKNG
ncbi:MAG: hypothetical protein LBJ78_00650 [Puniceicoccales bacterium]|jgi:transcriptional regulator with XRE-family HTH domain|nr:hypothetical protein [Puniceicoccales bacterium]